MNPVCLLYNELISQVKLRNCLGQENITLINLDVHQYFSKKTLSVPLDALKKQTGHCNELEVAKLMKYYGFKTREELLDFLKYEHVQY